MMLLTYMRVEALTVKHLLHLTEVRKLLYNQPEAKSRKGK